MSEATDRDGGSRGESAEGATDRGEERGDELPAEDGPDGDESGPDGDRAAPAAAAREHLADVEDGCGCAEVWEHLSERRGADDD